MLKAQRQQILSCTFCTQHQCAGVQLTSTHPGRILVVDLCESCISQFVDILIDPAFYIVPKGGEQSG